MKINLPIKRIKTQKMNQNVRKGSVLHTTKHATGWI